MSSRALTIPLVLGLFMIACAPVASPPAAATAVSPAPPAARRAAIHFEERGGKPFPYPLVHVTVAGTPTAMILDTGATDHVLSTSFVKRLGLAVSAAKETGIDHAAKAISAAEIASPNLVVEGWGPVGAARVFAIDLPSVFDALGIGGILSPQRLAAAGESVVVDFPAGEVTALPRAAATARLAGKRAIEPAPSVCKKEDGGRQFAVLSQINGIAARLELDTGASHTDLRAGSAPGRQLESAAGAEKGATYAASGKMETKTLRAAAVRFGDVAKTIDVDIVPGDANQCFDGVLGMDALRPCVLVLDDASAAAACGI
jgi:predicted aspartyl protease